mgnify:CR=1 FL=1
MGTSGDLATVLVPRAGLGLTYTLAIPPALVGTPIYTHLERTSQPMIRLVSGDLTQWEDGPTPCGRTYPRLPQGIFGRIFDYGTLVVSGAGNPQAPIPGISSPMKFRRSFMEFQDQACAA